VKKGTAKGISLPIRVFEPRSLVDKLCDFWSFAPVYLNKAAKLKDDPVERFKNVIAFWLSSLHTFQSNQKPFMPVLGETFQGSFKDGTSISVEHVSHHPAKSAFYVKGNGWKLYGNIEYGTKLSLNALDLSYPGLNTIEFDDG
jgi:hypothetical protein